MEPASDIDERQSEVQELRRPEEHIFYCDRCGTRMVERNCKVICENCGNRFDCSDVTLYFD